VRSKVFRRRKNHAGARRGVAHHHGATHAKETATDGLPTADSTAASCGEATKPQGQRRLPIPCLGLQPSAAPGWVFTDLGKADRLPCQARDATVPAASAQLPWHGKECWHGSALEGRVGCFAACPPTRMWRSAWVEVVLVGRAGFPFPYGSHYAIFGQTPACRRTASPSFLSARAPR
jgi:hypothetical protein